jgi:hypothetical protein
MPMGSGAKRVAQIVQVAGIRRQRKFLGDAVPHQAGAHHGDVPDVRDVHGAPPSFAQLTDRTDGQDALLA